VSYIRCTSNPEGLYVYEQVQGGVVLWGGLPEPLSRFVMAPRGKEPAVLVMPVRDFRKLALRWLKDFVDVRVGRLRVREVWIHGPTGRIVSEDRLPANFRKMREHNLHVVLTYGRWRIAMWKVTWDYVCWSVERQLAWDRRAKAQSRRKDRP
jgi:hypothetical protein